MDGDTRIRAVIFDLGGVILRTEDPQPRLALAERLGISRAALEQAVFQNPTAQAGEQGQASLDEIWTAAARLVGLPAAEIPGFRRQFFGGDRVDFALVDFIRGLRPAYTTALLSNSWYADLDRALVEDLRILDAFDVVVSSAAEGLRKPDPRIFQIALKLVQAQPGEAVFVDDFEHNIEAAAALGMHVVHFRGAEQAMRELRALLGAPE